MLHAYAGVAEALHHEAAAHAESHAAAEPLHGHRVELRDLEEVLEQLGWDYEPVARALDVSGHPEVLADAVHGALGTAIEAFGRACSACWRGECRGDDVAARLAAVRGLVTLLAAVQDGEGAG